MDNFQGVYDVVLAAGGIIIIIIGRMLTTRQRSTSDEISKITGHVVNGHDTSMRDDIDQRFDGLSEDLRQVAKTQGQMWEALVVVRRDMVQVREEVASGRSKEDELSQRVRRIEQVHKKR
jgi:hypothetical protein